MDGTFTRWQIGDVRVTRVAEAFIESYSPLEMFTNVTPEAIKQVPWLSPHYATPEGEIRLSIHAFIVESQGKRIIVDTCVGNHKPRVQEFWNERSGPFLDDLTAAGFPPESIDYVLCTHMHFDHVGWNTRWDGTRWVPTFPNATYLFGRVEWEHWSQGADLNGDMSDPVAEALETPTGIADSVDPVIAAGLHAFVETDHALTEEVGLFPTPGHTPGHVSVAITSQGQRAVITGDMAHHPVQLWNPNFGTHFDHDRAQSAATRKAFVDSVVDQNVLVLGTHFAPPTGGRLVRIDSGVALVSTDAPDAVRGKIPGL